MDQIVALTGWDYLLAIVALVSIGVGAYRGMVRTVADLGSWILAFLAAPFAGPWITEFIGLRNYPWVGLVIGFVLVFFATRLLGVWLARGLNTVGLRGADRALGGVLGAARTILIIAVLATAGRLLDMDRLPAWKNAASREVLETLAGTVERYVPELQRLKRDRRAAHSTAPEV